MEMADEMRGRDQPDRVQFAAARETSGDRRIRSHPAAPCLRSAHIGSNCRYSKWLPLLVLFLQENVDDRLLLLAESRCRRFRVGARGLTRLPAGREAFEGVRDTPDVGHQLAPQSGRGPGRKVDLDR